MSRILAICALLISTPDVGLAVEIPDASQRISEWFLKVHELEQRNSVLVHEIQYSENKKNPNNTRLTESFYRRVTDSRTGVNRLDIQTMSAQVPSQYYSSILYTGKELYRTLGLEVGEGLRKTTDRALREPRAKSGFFLIPLCNDTGLNAGTEHVFSDMTTGRVLEERTLKDESYRVYYLPATGRALKEIVFREKPHWAPKSMRSYFNPGKPVDLATITLSQCKDWKEACRTETQWEQHDKDLWVPSKVTMWTEDNQAEVDFTGWQFGTNVDLTLLDPFTFTKEGIVATTKFDNWKAAFDEKADKNAQRKH